MTHEGPSWRAEVVDGFQLPELDDLLAELEIPALGLGWLGSTQVGAPADPRMHTPAVFEAALLGRPASGSGSTGTAGCPVARDEQRKARLREQNRLKQSLFRQRQKVQGTADYPSASLAAHSCRWAMCASNTHKPCPTLPQKTDCSL
jgi:hypothetical protein